MGVVCNKGKTKKIVIEQRGHTPKEPKEIEEQRKILNYIGEEFQITIQQYMKYDRRDDWTNLLKELNRIENEDSFQRIFIPIDLNTNDQLNIIEFDKLDEQQQQQEQEQRVLQRTNTTKYQNLISNNGIPFKLKSNRGLLSFYLLKECNQEKFSKALMWGAQSNIRWKAWNAQLYNNQLYDPFLYKKLVEQTDPKNEEYISKDICRTFPRHSYFQEQSQGTSQLYKILKALAINHPQVGYTQGMNQVAAFALIISGGNEEEAFWLINFMALDPRFLILDIYKPQFQYAKLLMQIFHHNFKKQLPGLYEHFQEQYFSEHSYIWQWILTLFLYTFPMEYVMYFWDYILASNILAMLSLSISLLQSYGPYLIQKDIEGISVFFQNIQNSENRYKINIKEVIEDAIKFHEQLEYLECLSNCVYSQIIRNNFVLPDQINDKLY